MRLSARFLPPALWSRMSAPAPSPNQGSTDAPAVGRSAPASTPLPASNSNRQIPFAPSPPRHGSLSSTAHRSQTPPLFRPSTPPPVSQSSAAHPLSPSRSDWPRNAPSQPQSCLRQPQFAPSHPRAETSSRPSVRKAAAAALQAPARRSPTPQPNPVP